MKGTSFCFLVVAGTSSPGRLGHAGINRVMSYITIVELDWINNRHSLEQKSFSFYVDFLLRLKRWLANVNTMSKLVVINLC